MRRLQSLIILVLISVFGPICDCPAQSGGDFVAVSGGSFRLSGKEYRAMGFTAYELNVGKDRGKNTRTKLERIFRVAKEHGFTLFRATSIVYDFNTADLDKQLSDDVWAQVDLILDVAQKLDMKVVIDFSTMTYAAGRLSSPPFDVTAPDNFERLKAIYASVPNRRNSINRRLYKDDPTIMAYSILGEIVPFGLNKKPDGSVDLKNESRSADNYVAFVSRAAAELKRNDPRHLVNAGGLLHITPDGPVKTKAGVPYWKAVWSDPNIDFGSIHIYCGPPKGAALPLCPPYTPSMPWGQWKNLGAYVSYASSIGKPFMLEEWGLNIEEKGKVPVGERAPLAYSPQAAQDYFSAAFGCMVSARVPVAVLWQWSPGGKFNMWPGESPEEDAIVRIIRDNAFHFRGRP